MKNEQATELNVPPAVHRYMQELELQLKQIPGVSPEEALSDAREFLLADYDALTRSAEPPDPQIHYEWIVAHFGEPQQVALQYSAESPAVNANVKPGYAPGWRICCTKCGRSAPLAATGAIRVGAFSIHKYVLGRCGNCNRLRWCRVIRDLDQTNLTDQLCSNVTPEQLRKSMHFSVFKMVAGIVSLIVAIQIVVWLVLIFWFRVFDKPQQVHWGEQIVLVASQERDPSQKTDYSPTIEKLRQVVENKYSYRDLRGIDWPRRFEEMTPKLMQSKSDQELVNGLADLMSVAKDIHVWLDFAGKNVATFQAKTELNFNPRALPKVLKSYKQHGTTVITGQATSRVQYVLIATWDHREPAAFQAAYQAIQQAVKDGSPLIIDVRPNSGGDERQAQAVASFFVDKPLVYAASRSWQDGQPGDITRRTLQPSKDGLKHTGPCLVLMGPNNMSSCESFLRMMRVAGVQLVGAASRGTSGNPQPHDLGHGIRIFLPSWQQIDSAGQVIEGEAIKPDVLIQTKPGDFSNSDPILLRAIELLSSPR